MIPGERASRDEAQILTSKTGTSPQVGAEAAKAEAGTRSQAEEGSDTVRTTADDGQQHPAAGKKEESKASTLEPSKPSPVIIGCFDSNGKCNLLAWRKALAKLKACSLQDLQVCYATNFCSCKRAHCYSSCACASKRHRTRAS